MPVEFSAKERLFVLSTANTAYTMRLTEDGRLLHSYWGTRLPYLSDYPALLPDEQFTAQNAHLWDMQAEFPIVKGIQEIEPSLRLNGLEPNRIYRIEGDLAKGEPHELSGQALLSRGILPDFNSHFDSALIRYRIHTSIA